jgi:Protein of unknown function (DUF2628)
MATFSVHTRGAPDSEITLVREGFSVTAFIFGPFWFAFQRAWLGLAAWVGGMLTIIALAAAVGAPPLPVAGAIVAFMLLMALEACQFRRRSLARRGFKLADVVETSRRNEADIRFLARSLSGQAQGGALPGASRPQSQRVETVGLFLNGT